MGRRLLPEEVREAVARHIDGESRPSIARSLGVTPQTIRNHIQAAGAEVHPGGYWLPQTPPRVDTIAYEGRWVHDGHMIQRGAPPT